MKKQILFLAFILFLILKPTNIFSQFVTAGTATTNNLFTGGNVGVGYTTLPAFGTDKFVVNGNSLFNGQVNSNLGFGTTGSNALFFKMGSVPVGRVSFYLYANTAFGYNSYPAQDGLNPNNGFNTAYGFSSLFSNTAGNGNTANGANALYSNISGSANSAFGSFSLRNNTTGQQNNAFGQTALGSNTTGNVNNAFGISALTANTTGSSNNAFGTSALGANVNGSSNNSFGLQSLFSNTSGNFNNAFGELSLQNNTAGTRNNAFGYGSLRKNTSSFNSAFGDNSLVENTTGAFNSAFGNNSLAANITGTQNTAIGKNSGSILTAGNYNLFIGADTQPNISNTSSNQINIANAIYGWNSNIGIGVLNPSAKLEIQNGSTANSSGLKLTNLTSTFNPTTTATKFLTVDSTGNVILQNTVASTGGTTIAAGTNITATGSPSTGYTISSPSQVLSQSGNTISLSNGGGSVNLPVTPAVNIYNSDGTLLDNRQVNMNSKNLYFSTTQFGGKNIWFNPLGGTLGNGSFLNVQNTFDFMNPNVDGDGSFKIAASARFFNYLTSGVSQTATWMQSHSFNPALLPTKSNFPLLFNPLGGNIGINLGATTIPTAQLHTKGTVRLESLATNTTDTKFLTTDVDGNVTTRDLSTIVSSNTDTNIYNTDGILTSDRFVNNGVSNLRFGDIERFININPSQFLSDQKSLLLVSTHGVSKNPNLNSVGQFAIGAPKIGNFLTQGVNFDQTWMQSSRTSNPINPTVITSFLPLSINPMGGNLGVNLGQTTLPTAQFHTKGTVRLESLAINTTNTKILTTDVDGNVTTRDLSTIVSSNTNTNIYNSNGVLTNDRYLDLNGKILRLYDTTCPNVAVFNPNGNNSNNTIPSYGGYLNIGETTNILPNLNGNGLLTFNFGNEFDPILLGKKNNTFTVSGSEFASSLQSSQFVSSGNGIYRALPLIVNPLGGNIGINLGQTTIPTAQLHSKGTVRLEDLQTNTYNTKILTTDVDGNVTTRDINSLVPTPIIDNIYNNDGTLVSDRQVLMDSKYLNFDADFSGKGLTINPFGNIIGSGSILNVNNGYQFINPNLNGDGSTQISAYSKASSFLTNGISSAGTWMQASRISRGFTSNFPIFLNPLGGNIGINLGATTSPTAQFHSKGTVRLESLSTNIVNTNILTTDALGNVTIRDINSLVPTPAPNVNIYNSDGTIEIDRTINLKDKYIRFNDDFGNQSILSPLNFVNGTDAFSSIKMKESRIQQPNYNGWGMSNIKDENTGVSLTQGITKDATWLQAGISSDFFKPTSYNLLINPLRGNVGIGTAQPTAQFHTNGTVRLQSLLTNTVNTNVLTTDVAGNVTTRDINTLVPVTTNTLTNATNIITSIVNGVTATAQAINTNQLTLTGNNLQSTVNGVSSIALNLSSLVPVTTNTLTNPLNTITSTVNGIAVSATAVNTVLNTSTANSLTTTVNGVTGLPVSVVNTNTLTLNGNSVTSTVNGVSSTALDLSSLTTPSINIYNTSANLLSNRVVGLDDKTLDFNFGTFSTALTSTGFKINPSNTNANFTFAVNRNQAPNLLGNGHSRIEQFVSTTSKSFLTTGFDNNYFWTQSSNSSNSTQNYMINPLGGKVAIGTFNIDACADCADYRLFVKQGIRTEKVRVDLANIKGWADFVFNKDYKLMTLKETENYIIANKHLPNVPSAEEVVKTGIDLGAMDAKLLEKIEELTLHTIEINKKNESLEKDKNEQQALIQTLIERLVKLELKVKQ